jgi:hypothetical protein
MTTKQPSIAQMRVRFAGGHRKVLEALRDGRQVTVQRAGDASGLMTCRATLIGWGCIEDGAITERGRQLLEAVNTHYGRT